MDGGLERQLRTVAERAGDVVVACVASPGDGELFQLPKDAVIALAHALVDVNEYELLRRERLSDGVLLLGARR
jgi:hypothetical protein